MGNKMLEGVLWMVATTLLFALVTAAVRYVGTSLPAPQMAFIRYGLGLFLMLPFMGGLITHWPSKKHWQFYAIRGVFHGIGVMLWFYAMAHVPMAEVTALGYLVPIFVSIGAVIFLGEVIQFRRIIAIIFAFIGALIILRPGFVEIGWGQLAQLSAGPLFACSYLIAKTVSDNASPSVIVGMLSFFCTLTLFPFAWAVWVHPSWVDLGLLFLTAILATSGHYTMTRAIKIAPLTLTQPITFLQLVWASVLGILFFQEAVDIFVLIGGGVVVSATTFIAHREAKLKSRQTTPPSTATKL